MCVTALLSYLDCISLILLNAVVQAFIVSYLDYHQALLCLSSIASHILLPDINTQLIIVIIVIFLDKNLLSPSKPTKYILYSIAQVVRLSTTETLSFFPN